MDTLLIGLGSGQEGRTFGNGALKGGALELEDLGVLELEELKMGSLTLMTEIPVFLLVRVLDIALRTLVERSEEPFKPGITAGVGKSLGLL